MQMHKPPSRIRYEKSHPTISFRLNKKLKERLEKALEGKSFARFVKEGLGEIKREKESIENAKKEGYNEGYLKGYDEATRKFIVTTDCAYCGERVVIRHPKQKEVLSQLMRDSGWCHLHCADMIEREKRRGRERY